MIRKTKETKNKVTKKLLLILLVFSILLSACGLVDKDQVEGIVEDEWHPENPKQTFTEWWEDTRSGQDEKLGTGFERFMNWLPEPIAKLLGRESESTPYVESSPEDFSNIDQLLSAYQFKVPEEVIEYFEVSRAIPPEEIRLRLEMIARAEAYPRDIPYDMGGTDPFGYRTDCSGFVSYIWQLETSSDTTSMIAYSEEITLEELMPGDVLNNKRYAAAGHIVLFSHWVDLDAKIFKAYHMNATANGVSANTLQLIPDPNVDGAWTINEIGAAGPFYPYRWNGFVLAE
ncbi:MAG: C40 family peptidase [Anaerolineales bacterium]|nr:C40 family peptidase [Anaerolineales bacterium]